MSAQQNEFMTARDVARLLKVSVRQVWRLRAAGQLPQPIKIGGSVRWDARDIEAWIVEQKGAANPQ